MGRCIFTTILSCLYYDSSNCVSSILCFCILDLPKKKKHLLYVCDSFLPFFLFWYWRAVRFLPLLAPEGSKLQISVLSGHLNPKICKIRPFAGCRWSWTGLQTETSQQNGRPEWPNCTLNLTPHPRSWFLFLSFFFFFYLLCVSLLSFNLHVVLVLCVFKTDALRRNSKPLEFYFFSTTWKLKFLCQYPKIPCSVWLIFFKHINV